jgi:hypothetical protein
VHLGLGLSSSSGGGGDDVFCGLEGSGSGVSQLSIGIAQIYGPRLCRCIVISAAMSSSSILQSWAVPFSDRGSASQSLINAYTHFQIFITHFVPLF